MPIPLSTLSDTLSQQPLFKDKTWRMAPEPWPLTAAQCEQLEQIGAACQAFYLAVDQLYRWSVSDKNLLRNQQLRTPWVAEYFERGKPAQLIHHGRNPSLKGQIPVILRPDLLLTESGFVLTELDSVPGGIGLIAFLNQLYTATDSTRIHSGFTMIDYFYQALCALRPAINNPVVAIVVSDEAETYRPEFEYLAGVLQAASKRVYVAHPNELKILADNVVGLQVNGDCVRVEIIYRFWELFDMGTLECADGILAAVEQGTVIVTPPMKTYQEEKLNLALLHHPMLESYWREALPKSAWRTLQRIVPHSWIMDPVNLPPNAVLDAPCVRGNPIRSWEQLSEASQKERDLILKMSGFHESAWGARSVVLGSDVSKSDWQAAIMKACDMAKTHLHILQKYHKPMRVEHSVYRDDGTIVSMSGRVRLCPYYAILDGKTELSAVLATICPADKKIIHGMSDAALLPCRVE